MDRMATNEISAAERALRFLVLAEQVCDEAMAERCRRAAHDLLGRELEPAGAAAWRIAA